jgi:hypothetical protein
MSIPAGAAGRGERNGWTGDAAFGSECTLMHSFIHSFIHTLIHSFIHALTHTYSHTHTHTHGAGESEMYDFDTAAFFSRYIDQLLDSQCPNGELGNGVPAAGSNTR